MVSHEEERSTESAEQVEHDDGARRFFVNLPEGMAYLAYAPAGRATIDLQHTIVPPEAQGRGVGASLAAAAFAYARAQGLQVIPSCPFVAAWLDDHPDGRDVVADTDRPPAA
jgi:predicted GNAT family acetyltransferase